MSDLTEEEMIALVNKTYPQMNAVPMSQFTGEDEDEGIWFRQEGAEIDGLRVHNEYHGDRYDIYDPTTLIVFNDFLAEHGWYPEPYDAGTLMAYLC